MTLCPNCIVSLLTARRSFEVTFQEARAHLGFTTPRNRSKKSVLRTAPRLLGLFSVVSLMFARQLGDRRRSLRDRCPQPMGAPWYAKEGAPWYAKEDATFSDAITAVRRSCWERVLKRAPIHAGVAKLPRQLRRTLLDHLSRAA